jgi:hypothetical protein
MHLKIEMNPRFRMPRKAATLPGFGEVLELGPKLLDPDMSYQNWRMLA